MHLVPKDRRMRLPDECFWRYGWLPRKPFAGNASVAGL
jgi:hypothetical protein